MTITPLRQFAKRHGTMGLLLAGIYVAARLLWTNKRVTLFVCLAVLLTGRFAFESYYHRRVSHGGSPETPHRFRLYVGRITTEEHSAPKPLDAQLLGYWAEDSITPETRNAARDFATAIKWYDRNQAVILGNRLCSLFSHPQYEMWSKDGKWLIHAVIGDIYLKQGWLEEAKHEFQGVLSAVPAGEPHWGKSTARQTAAYGLARANSLCNTYDEALQKLAQAPGEYNGGCGNHNEWEATENHPMEGVWSVAKKPFPVAEVELLKIMDGYFTPMKAELNGDNSEEQRQHAAAEAGLTLGCLYEREGRYTDARACWILVAANANPKFEAVSFAQLLRD